MSSIIDTELATLHARIAHLEEAKKNPPPPAPPKSTLDLLLIKARERVKNNQWREKESPIATACRFSYQSQTEMLEFIVESLNRIHARLDALETK